LKTAIATIDKKVKFFSSSPLEGGET